MKFSILNETHPIIWMKRQFYPKYRWIWLHHFLVWYYFSTKKNLVTLKHGHTHGQRFIWVQKERSPNNNNRVQKDKNSPLLETTMESYKFLLWPPIMYAFLLKNELTKTHVKNSWIFSIAAKGASIGILTLIDSTSKSSSHIGI